MNSGEPTRARASMIARAVSVRTPLNLAQAAQHERVLAKRGQRLHGGVELKACAFAQWRPASRDDSVRHVYEPQAHYRVGRAELGRGERGYHCVQKRESQSGP